MFKFRSFKRHINRKITPAVVNDLFDNQTIKRKDFNVQYNSKRKLSNRFLTYIHYTRILEGNWSNDESDPGGMTMYGLSSKHNKSLRSEIANKTLDQTKAYSYIYKKYYLTLVNIELIDIKLGFVVFDARFHGMREVIGEIQKKINEKSLSPFPLVVDNIWGPKTAEKALKLSPSSINDILDHLSLNAFRLGNLAAVRVLNYQKRHNLKLKDYTIGFKNRMAQRVSYAYDAVYG